MNTERLKRKLLDAQENGDVSLEASISKKIADQYYENAFYEEAMPFYKIEERANKKLGKAMAIAISQRMLCESCICLGEFKTAIFHGTKYLQIALAEKSLLEEQRAWVTIGRAHYALATSIGADCDDIDKKKLHKSSLAEAYQAYKRGLKLMSKLRLDEISHKELAEMNCRLMLNMALVVELQGDMTRAVEYLTDAVKLCKTRNLFDDLYRCYNVLGDLYRNVNILDKSLEYFSLAVLAAKPLDNPNTMCEALLAKSKVLISQGHYKQAKEILRTARNLQTNTSLRDDLLKTRKVARCLLRTERAVANTADDDYQNKKELFEKLGDVSARFNNYSKAIEYYQQMLKNAKLAGDMEQKLVPAYVSLAQTYRDLKQYDKVIEYYKLELEVHFDDPQEACLSTLNIADALYLSGACYAEIEEEFFKARSLADETGKPKMVGKVLNQLLKLQVAKKLTKEAAETLRELDLLNIPEDESDESDIEESPELILSDSDSTESEEEFDRPKQPRQRQKFKWKNNEKGESPLHTACIQNKFAAVQALIKQGHPVNEYDNCGWTPLHEACNKGYYKIVELLLDNGARMNEEFEQCGGVTPLHDAATNYHPLVIELLLERGADSTRVDVQGKTALHYLLDVYKRDKDASNQAELNMFYDLEDKLRNNMIKAGYLIKNMPPKSIELEGKPYKIVKSTLFSQVPVSRSSQSSNDKRQPTLPAKPNRVNNDRVSQRRLPPDSHRPEVHKDKPKTVGVSQRRFLVEVDSEEETFNDSRWEPLSPAESEEDAHPHLGRECSPDQGRVSSPLSSPEIEDVMSPLKTVMDEDSNDNDAVETYSKVMTSLRFSNASARESAVQLSALPISKSSKAKVFLAEDEVAAEDWLEEDCRPEKNPKKRKLNVEKRVDFINSTSTRVSGFSRSHCGSASVDNVSTPTSAAFETTQKPPSRVALPVTSSPPLRSKGSIRQFITDSVRQPISDSVGQPINDPYRSRRDDWENSPSPDPCYIDDDPVYTQIDRDYNKVDNSFCLQQTSLTDSRFHRHTSSESANRNARLSPTLGLSRQTTVESSSARVPHPEPPESLQRAPQPAPVQPPAMRPSLGIKVRVQGTLLFIPLKSQDQTFRSLSAEVADRYCRQFSVRPTLSLHTKDGALLIDSDPVSLVFGCDEILSTVLSWNIATLTERYEESCKRLDVIGNSSIKGCLSVCSGSLIVNDFALPSHLLAPLFLAIHKEDKLTRLDLSGNLLADKGIKLLSECLPRLQQLKELNLSCNAITQHGLKYLSDVVQPQDVYQPLQVASTDTQRLLQNLTDLDLSHNFFSDNESWAHLSNLLDGLSLNSLHLQSCHLRNDTAAFPPLLSLETVANLDISFNPLGCEGVSSFLGRLSADQVVSINMAATAQPNSFDSVTTVLRLFLERKDPSKLRSLDLSNNNINDIEILEVLKLLDKAVQFESLYLRNNPSLTCVALKTLLQKGIGQSMSNLDLSGCWNIYDNLETFTVPLGVAEEEHCLLRLKSLTLSTDKTNQARGVEQLWSEAFCEKAVIQKGPFGMLHLTKK